MITIAIFMINQMILRKTLIIIMKVKSCLSDIHKSELFNVQKLQLQEAMTVNDITHDMLNAY